MKRRTNFVKIFSLLLSLLWINSVQAQISNNYELKSPDGDLSIQVNCADKLTWSVKLRDQVIILPSAIGLELMGGKVLGQQAKVLSAKKEVLSSSFSAINYKKAIIEDNCSQLTINFKGGFGIVFRTYDDAVAYRFFTDIKDEMIVKNEIANYNFSADHTSYIPYMWDYRGGEIFNHSFEALYSVHPISKFRKDSLAILPLLVDMGQNKKVVILEADLEDYPGMNINLNETKMGFKGVFAPYPLEVKIGGYADLNLIPTKRAYYILKSSGKRNFPWRVMAVSEEDKELLNNDIVQKLASPSRIKDISWIKPGQVAWDWWNDWNISHVDFKAGMNTETYKYYIDFASANGLEYIVIDDGWSLRADLTKVVPAMDLPTLVAYGKTKSVDIIIWASWQAIMNQMDVIFPLYSKMGIKGFKIDFIDRDDQIAVASTYTIAKKAAEYQLLVDYHGVFKPTGLQRTYPNVMGYEGVLGLETMKWAHDNAPQYTVSIPFIRMMAGPMDYTPGAMRNAAKHCFRPIGSNPMSQGTRCHQMAMYVVFEAPLQMLADNPNAYMNERECTDFIARTPVVYDETVALDSQLGEYVAIARRKGEAWFVGVMSNWNARQMSIDFSFLGDGQYQAVIFKDGVNADRDGTDYKKEVLSIDNSKKLDIQLQPGGGWAARIEKVK